MQAGTLERGIELFNTGEYFECHEVLEDLWREERGARRDFLQALIHAAVALHHRARGNPRGATGQLRKALAKLAPYLPEFEGVNTARLHADLVAAATGESRPHPISIKYRNRR